MVVQAVVVGGLGCSLLRRLDPHRVGSPEAVRFPAVAGDLLRGIAALLQVFRAQAFVHVDVGVGFRFRQGLPAVVPGFVDCLADAPAVGIVLVAGNRVAVFVLGFGQPVLRVVVVFLVVGGLVLFAAARGGFLDQATVVVPGVLNGLAVVAEEAGVFCGGFEQLVVGVVAPLAVALLGVGFGSVGEAVADAVVGKAFGG